MSLGAGGNRMYAPRLHKFCTFPGYSENRDQDILCALEHWSVLSTIENHY
jgi:hypothetical protein